MKFLKHILAAILAVGATAGARADETANASPYSMFGYGVLNDHVSASQRAMGGIGYALQSKRQINVKNPASYAAIDTMTFLFDIGANVGAVNLADKDQKFKKTLGGLDYVTMQVPIGKWMGASIGLLPYSSTGYKFGAEITDGLVTNEGSGGISEAYLGWAARPVQGLSVGFNAGLLFGNIVNDTYVTANNGAQSLYERVTKVRDFNLQFGLQYSLSFNRDHKATLGLSYTLGHKLHGDIYGTRYDISTTSSTSVDTIGYTSLVHGFKLPHTFGAGLSYQWQQRLTVGADFTYQPWKNVPFAGVEGFSDPQYFNNRFKAAIGGEYIPATRGNYFKRVAYRVGAFYGRDYVMVGNNSVKEYGVSCGFGLPTPVRTAVNLGFEYTHRNSSPVSTVAENYFMVTLGVALNEVWFVPSKIR
ncbi:MAG: hypothetical protein K2M49_01835 [Muribaculaceae bacterium]|nr:hypothetical protein [Muribaculaceae bacterium]